MWMRRHGFIIFGHEWSSTLRSDSLPLAHAEQNLCISVQDRRLEKSCVNCGWDVVPFASFTQILWSGNLCWRIASIPKSHSSGTDSEEILFGSGVAILERCGIFAKVHGFMSIKDTSKFSTFLKGRFSDGVVDDPSIIFASALVSRQNSTDTPLTLNALWIRCDESQIAPVWTELT